MYSIIKVLGESKESENWPAISRSTIAVVYKALLTTVVNEAKKVLLKDSLSPEEIAPQIFF